MIAPLPARTPAASDRVALVHDWLIGMRGGERCLEGFLDLLPGAPVHTLFHEPGSVSPKIEAHPIRASILSRFAATRHRHRWLFPLYPWVIDQLDTREAHAVFSLSHCAAKAAPKGDGARHICYCFTPARYLWDLEASYLAPGRTSWLQRLGGRAWFDELRAWDVATAAGVDRFIAISHHVAERIERIYGRTAEVIHPPVEVDRFSIAPPEEIGDHYLIVSALVEYKGVDLAIRAFAEDRSRRLKIIGDGAMEGRWKRLAEDLGATNIEWLGSVDDATVAREMARCRAFILPCDEDFGITPLEAMASGRPVVARGCGGALETVVGEGEARPATGVFFEEPTVDSLLHAFDRLERDQDRFDPETCRARATEFDRPAFLARIARVLREEGVEVPEGAAAEPAEPTVARPTPVPRRAQSTAATATTAPQNGERSGASPIRTLPEEETLSTGS